MTTHALVAIVTLLALILYFVMSLQVARARSQYNVAAPAISGNLDFERVFRVQANTLEWLPLFLVSLWLFAIFWNDRIAAIVGVVWIVGRILYMTGYTKEASARSMGFMVQALATGVLLFGALGRIIYMAISTQSF